MVGPWSQYLQLSQQRMIIVGQLQKCDIRRIAKAFLTNRQEKYNHQYSDKPAYINGQHLLTTRDPIQMLSQKAVKGHQYGQQGISL